MIYLPTLLSPEYLKQINADLLYPEPFQLYSMAGCSLIAATAFGAAYGLFGRVVYPNTGISPLHYAIWFALANQIKFFISKLDNHFENFLGDNPYLEKSAKISVNKKDIKSLICTHYWKAIQFQNNAIKKIDRLFSAIFHIRPSYEVKEENVSDASLIEMCRYRIWRVFNMAVLDILSFSTAYHLSNSLGFTISGTTALPLFIIARTIAVNITLIPSIYLYIRICNGPEANQKANSRSTMLWKLLPL